MFIYIQIYAKSLEASSKVNLLRTHLAKEIVRYQQRELHSFNLSISADEYRCARSLYDTSS